MFTKSFTASIFAFATVNCLAAPTVERMWLIDADTDTRIMQLEDYQSIPLPVISDNLSIEAEVNGETESVIMEINHVQSSLENLAPYSLVGDSSGDFDPAAELNNPGWIDISATPYSEDSAAGVQGDEFHLNLYLYQPDFFVNNPLDIGDYNPGDGYCSTKPIYTIPPWLVKKRIPLELETRDELMLNLERKEEDRRKFYTEVEAQQARSEKERESISWNYDRIDWSHNSLEPSKTKDLTIVDREIIKLPDDFVWPPFVKYGNCTLRAAIEESNALAGNQSVLIDGTIGVFNLTLGELHITDGITLNGYDLPLIDADKRSRVFRLGTGEDDFIVNMKGLEIANGDPNYLEGRGGAISVDNNILLQISDSMVRDSRANFGGGIYVQGGGVTVRRSAIRDNTAGHPDSFGGGGITQRGGGISGLESNIKIYDSSIFGNRAVRGGGISNFGGTVRVENSSVIENEAMSIGGGIENHHNGPDKGNLHINFSTVAHNDAGVSGAAPSTQRAGGGLYNSGWAYMANSIMSNNSDYWFDSDPEHAPDCYSPNVYDFKSFRNNIVGVLNENCSLTDYSWGNQAWIEHGSNASPLNDQLLNFSHYWDHRKYYMIKSTSLAIDEGNSQSASLYPCFDNDMRDRPRPVGDGCDIGAIERQ
jgi:hypothetical protein